MGKVLKQMIQNNSKHVRAFNKNKEFYNNLNEEFKQRSISHHSIRKSAKKVMIK